MKLAERLKSAAAKIPAAIIEPVIGAIIGIIPALFKKKAFTLWYNEPSGWKSIGTFSHRQCRKQMAELIRIGYDPAKFAIFRKGVVPGVPK
jgi:hypothetical protein